jgi:hypothetical protein
MTPPWRRVARGGTAFGLAVLAVAARVKAQDPAPAAVERTTDHRSLAVDLFRQGSEAFERGDFAAAASAFEASHRHVPRAAAIYNAARSWDAAGDRPRAADDFETAIERTDLREPEAGAARARLTALESAMGIVQINGPRGAVISVSHAQGVPLPARIHLEPGGYTITATMPDGTRTLRAVSVVSQKIAIVTMQPAMEAEAPPKPPAEAGSGVPLLPVVAFGAAGAAAVAGAILGLEALDARAAFSNNPSSQRALDEAHAYRNWANVAWVATGVFAATAVVLLFTLPKKGSGAAPAGSPRP